MAVPCSGRPRPLMMPTGEGARGTDTTSQEVNAMRTIALLLAIVVSALPALAQQDEFTTAPLDDFEDTSPWIKGDPNTDLTQKDAAVTPSSKVVHEGE